MSNDNDDMEWVKLNNNIIIEKTTRKNQKTKKKSEKNKEKQQEKQDDLASLHQDTAVRPLSAVSSVKAVSETASLLSEDDDRGLVVDDDEIMPVVKHDKKTTKNPLKNIFVDKLKKKPVDYNVEGIMQTVERYFPKYDNKFFCTISSFITNEKMLIEAERQEAYNDYKKQCSLPVKDQLKFGTIVGGLTIIDEKIHEETSKIMLIMEKQNQQGFENIDNMVIYPLRAGEFVEFLDRNFQILHVQNINKKSSLSKL